MSINDLPQDSINESVTSCIIKGNYQDLQALKKCGFIINDSNRHEVYTRIIEYINNGAFNLDKILNAFNLSINDLSQHTINQIVITCIEKDRYVILQQLMKCGFIINDANKHEIYTAIIEHIKEGGYNYCVDEMLKAFGMIINDLPQDLVKRIILDFIKKGNVRNLTLLKNRGFTMNYGSAPVNSGNMSNVLKTRSYICSTALPPQKVYRKESSIISANMAINDTDKSEIYNAIIERITNGNFNYMDQEVLKALDLGINDLPQDALNQIVLGFFERSVSAGLERIQKAGFDFGKLPQAQVVKQIENSVKEHNSHVLDLYNKYYYKDHDQE
nr:hypothetical protein [Endozoicomonas sp.]